MAKRMLFLGLLVVSVLALWAGADKADEAHFGALTARQEVLAELGIK